MRILPIWAATAVAASLLLCAVSWAQERKSEPPPDPELAALREAAETQASAGAGTPEARKAPSEGFQALGLALQALNPQISVAGDMMGCWRQEKGERGVWSFIVRSLELQLDSYLDPSTKFKAVVAAEEDASRPVPFLHTPTVSPPCPALDGSVRPQPSVPPRPLPALSSAPRSNPRWPLPGGRRTARRA